MFELTTPRFLLAEEPIKDLSNEAPNRVWIYAPFCLSLIECISLSEVTFIPFESNRTSKDYEYFSPLYQSSETWKLIFIQENTEVAAEAITPEQLLDQAWEFYSNYMLWEDTQM